MSSQSSVNSTSSDNGSERSSEQSNSVGRNSLIMAAGTAASRVTGQIRSILLAAAIGTTGIAANAYQTGSMIPQSLARPYPSGNISSHNQQNSIQP